MAESQNKSDLVRENVGNMGNPPPCPPGTSGVVAKALAVGCIVVLQSSV